MSLPSPKQLILVNLTCFLSNLCLYGETEFSQKILLLREKSKEHKTYVNNVLSQSTSYQSPTPAVSREEGELTVQDDIPEVPYFNNPPIADAAASPSPTEAVPEWQQQVIVSPGYTSSDPSSYSYTSNASPNVGEAKGLDSTNFSKPPVEDVSAVPPPTEVVPERQQQVVASPGYTSSDPLYPYASNISPNVDASNDLDSTNVADAYRSLYESKSPERRLGYYFGPFIGAVFPDDLAVNGNVNQSDNGPLFGLRVGRDFGAIRVEGEYSYIFYDLNQGGDVSLHNFFSRFILENAVGDRADFRAGIGLGLTSLGVASEHEICFAYDFLLGWSYRISNFWGLSLDYRHFLSASSQTFSRVQGHVLEASANFDF